MIAAGTRELLRYLVAWLLMAPDRYGVRFSDGGIEKSAGEEMDVVEAKGQSDFAARLFFNQQSRLVMLTYQEPPTIARPAAPVAETTKPNLDEPLFKSIEPWKPSPPGETRLRLADYRADDGILFPHRMTFESGPKVQMWDPRDPTRRIDVSTSSEWTIKRFSVNAPLDSKYFNPR